MRADSTQPHYAPASVGGLMDPAFVRGARLAADGGHAETRTTNHERWERLQAAMQHVMTALRRR